MLGSQPENIGGIKMILFEKDKTSLQLVNRTLFIEHNESLIRLADLRSIVGSLVYGMYQEIARLRQELLELHKELGKMIEKIERLKAIKEQMNALNAEREAIELEVDEKVIYQNEDGTWTRFTKIDNIEELKRGTLFRSTSVNRYTTKLETLKNKPKELKEGEA